MNVNIEISIDKEDWDNIENLTDKIGAAAKAAFNMSDRIHPFKNRNVEISFLLTSDKIIQQLNSQYRDKDTATNVLSFPQYNINDPLPEGPVLLGDIILAYETVAREAEAKGKPLAEHACHLAVHGTLHLLGYDHMSSSEARAMETLENKIMESLGYTTPYELS